MSEYIERGALMEEIRKHIETIGINAERLVARFAPADVEPVVRCKNCVKWGKRDCKRNPCVIDISSMDEFCSDGERKAHMERSGSGEI